MSPKCRLCLRRIQPEEKVLNEVEIRNRAINDDAKLPGKMLKLLLCYVNAKRVEDLCRKASL